MMNDGLRDIPIIFPDFLIHSDMFRNLRTIMPTGREGRFFTLVSAGFINLAPKLVCYGKSETLGVESRGQLDSDIILLYPYQHGIYDEFMAEKIKVLLEDQTGKILQSALKSKGLLRDGND
jgi:hypothetical protein